MAYFSAPIDSFFPDRRERPPNRVLAEDLAHVEKLRQHAAASRRRDMRVEVNW